MQMQTVTKTANANNSQNLQTQTVTKTVNIKASRTASSNVNKTARRPNSETDP